MSESDGEEYVVEKVVDKRIKNGKVCQTKQNAQKIIHFNLTNCHFADHSNSIDGIFTEVGWISGRR